MEQTETAAETPYDPHNDPDGYTEEDLSHHDFYLNLFLDMVMGRANEARDSAVGLTLTTTGGLVTGMAITPDAWHELVAADLPPNAGAMGKAMKRVHEQLQADHRESVKSRDERHLPSVPRKFVHMKDVTLASGGERVTFKHWRCRIDTISGWTPGLVNFR